MADWPRRVVPLSRFGVGSPQKIPPMGLADSGPPKPCGKWTRKIWGGLIVSLLPGSSGVGRTGAFCLLYAAMQEVEAGNSIPDLVQLVKHIRRQRKHMLQEKVRGAGGSSFRSSGLLWEGGFLTANFSCRSTSGSATRRS